MWPWRLIGKGVQGLRHLSVGQSSNSRRFYGAEMANIRSSSEFITLKLEAATLYKASIYFDSLTFRLRFGYHFSRC